CQVVRLSSPLNGIGRPVEWRPPATPLLEFARLVLAEEELAEESTRSSICLSGQEQRTFVEISVSDTGSGIAQDDLEHIFQPFYTTKAHGIGLGLPITRRLIEDHHGSILVESQLGYGTTVSVRLPVSEGK
ncbi:MAG: ATP-binding protein, partial [Ktedonobacteraceae bacterium]